MVNSADSIAALLRRAALAADRIATEEMKSAAITPTQLVVLQAVQAQPGIPQRALIDVTGVGRSVMSDVLRRLERNGLITRSGDDKDGRVRRVRLAAGAETRIRAADEMRSKADVKIINSMPLKVSGVQASIQSWLKAFSNDNPHGSA